MTDTSIIDSLLAVMRDLRRHFDEAARDMGLTMARAKIITTLHREQGMTQTALAAQLGIETPTLKRQLDGWPPTASSNAARSRGTPARTRSS